VLEIDRWALSELDHVIAATRDAYERYEFHEALRTLFHFCTVTLSARYFDIIKDRLYTYAPRNVERRAAQTVLLRIVDSLARLLAPVLAFTADEIWEYLPKLQDDILVLASVHMACFPDSSPVRDQDFMTRWNRLFLLRDQVLGDLEKERIEKRIGSPLEACVVIDPRSDFDRRLLEQYKDQLRYIFIVSQIRFAGEGEITSGSPVLTQFKIERAQGQKCERCWNYSTRVGESAKYPTVCERCVAALDEIEGG
jgi:isoleucyl-tRNA synthetase